MPITLAGLGSGLDVNTILTQLQAIEQQPVTAAQTNQSRIQSASQTISTFSTKLGALQTAARALASPTGFTSCAASSSQTAVVASASGGATPGGYDVTVTQLAREQRTYSDVQASGTAALGMSGDIALTVGAGAVTHIPVTAGDSLTAIAARITGSGQRVSASVLFDGTTYKLQVRGLDSGAANALTLAETGTSLGLATPANTYQSALDARLTVDGILVTRPTNQVTGVIPGVTLALTGNTTGAATVTVATDPSGLSQRLGALVSAYNDVVNSGHSAAGYGGSKASNPVLAGDRTIRRSLDALMSIVTAAVPGATGRYTTLGSLGLSLTNEGTLALNATKLSAALSADPAAVARLFVTDPATGATGAMDTLVNKVTELTGTSTSLVRTRITSLGSQARRTGVQITAMQDRVNAHMDQLRAQFATLDSVVSNYRAMSAAITAGTG